MVRFKLMTLVPLRVGLLSLAFARTASADEQTITSIVKPAAADAKGQKIEIKGAVEDKDGTK